MKSHTRIGTFHETTPNAASIGGTIVAAGKTRNKAINGRLKTLLTEDLMNLTTTTPIPHI